MLKRTYVHLPGVAYRTEAYFWRRGLSTWEEFLAAPQIPGLSRDRLGELKRGIQESLDQLDNIAYFGACLPAREHWRLFEHFRPRAVFVDIETYGSAWPPLLITVIGLFDGTNLYQFLQGHNLHHFPAALAAFDMIITYNGTQFDLPVLKAHFPQLTLPAVHLDLRFILARLGFKGGLKKIEPLFGIVRPPEIVGLDGYHAVLLWERYQRGDLSALDILLRYNREDVINLEVLMTRAFAVYQDRLLRVIN